MISIVSPVYRAANILPTLVREIKLVMEELAVDYEVVLVDDRSPDDSWQVMKKIASENEKIKIFRLSRNFGQHPTIMAGLSKTQGDLVVVMDCDMQDQPKEIKKLYIKMLEGYDIVQAARVIRKDGYFKKLSSSIFYKCFNYLAGIEINREVANFGIYNRKVVDSVLRVGDYIKFFPLFVNWVGFNATTVAVEHATREEGKSSYSFSKLLSLAFNVIISFSEKPLKIFVGLGAGISLLSLFVGGFFFIWYLLGNITEPGFISIILSIWFLSGAIISSVGIVGIYLGKTFNQVKNRPVFILDEE